MPLSPNPHPSRPPQRSHAPQPNAHLRSPLLAWSYYLGRRIVLPLHFQRIHITGQIHLPRTGPVILAPTHRSRWDALLVPYATGRHVSGRDLHFMVTANEMRGCQGWLIRRLGGFAIDPCRPGIASLRHGLHLLQAGQMLTIFPEGDIFRDGCIHPLKPGLARLALQAERDRPGLNPQIVPIHIRYDRPVPTWGSTAIVQIGHPIAIGPYRSLPPKTATRAILTDLHFALDQLATPTP